MSKITSSDEIIGKTFGQLTIIQDLGVIQTTGKKRRHLVVKCTCGNTKTIRLTSLTKTKEPTRSCGCLQKKATTDRNTKHNLCSHPLYYVWMGMRDRCYNINSKQYKDWGGRGINVCAEWIDDFKAFYDWAISNGWQKGLDLDREQNDCGYSPNNCRFVSRKVGNRNKRNNVMIDYKGETKPLSQWAEDLQLPYKKLHARVRILKWNISEAFQD